MARKNVVIHQLESQKPMDATFTTEPTLIRNLDNCSYQIDFTTSDAVGTFTVEASNDYQIDEVSNNVVNSGHWVTLPLTGSPVAASSDDDILIDLNQLSFNAIRLVYTRTSGTGLCDAYIMCRQIGG